jgi:hypothetical protein
MLTHRLVEDKHSSYDGLLDRVGRKVDGGTLGWSFVCTGEPRFPSHFFCAL